MMMKLIISAFLLVGTVSSARGDAYVGLGMGTKAPLKGAWSGEFNTSGARHGRLVVGNSFSWFPVGTLSLEGSLFGTELGRGGQESSGAGLSLSDDYTFSLGVDLKYRLGLLGALGAYARGGVHQTWLQSNNEMLNQYAGNGYTTAVGLDISANIATFWVDYSRQNIFLENEQNTEDLEGSADMLTAGVSVHF